MRSLAMGIVSLAWLTVAAGGEVIAWGSPASANQTADAVPIRLGRPVPIAAPTDDVAPPAEQPPPLSHASPIIRGQSPDIPPVAPPPPPPPPGGGVPPFPGGLPGGEEPYNCGVVAKDKPASGGFFRESLGETQKRVARRPHSLGGPVRPR